MRALVEATRLAREFLDTKLPSKMALGLGFMCIGVDGLRSADSDVIL